MEGPPGDGEYAEAGSCDLDAVGALRGERSWRSPRFSGKVRTDLGPRHLAAVRSFPRVLERGPWFQPLAVIRVPTRVCAVSPQPSRKSGGWRFWGGGESLFVS